MNNPRTPLTVQQRAQVAGPPPLGFNGNGIQINGIHTPSNPPGGRTCPFTGTPPTSAPGSTYTINGVVVNTCATKKIKSGHGIRYSKTFHGNLADKAKLDFIKQIEVKQQIVFLVTSISVTDLSKLINHYLHSKMVTELQRSMHKYSIHEIFTVVKPFDDDGPDAGRLKDDDNGDIIAINLFDLFHRVTVDEVVQSSCWYQGFGDDAARFW